MNKKILSYILIGLLIFFGTFLVGFSNKNKIPITLYKIYLEGESLGYISSKIELEEYINDKEKLLKEKYKVDKIHFPENLVIREEITFGKDITSIKKMYQKIIERKNFTIEGYEITIKGIDEQKEDKKIYTLDKTVFEEGLEETIKVFSGTDEYNNFITNNQKEIVEYGNKIEDIYIKESEENLISYQKKLIDTTNLIINNKDDMAKYILYGTLNKQKTYKVNFGDDLESIAFKNNLSPEEFLIANPNFNTMKNLVYPNQIVYIGLINPLVNIVVEKYVIEEQEEDFETDIIYDKNLYVGNDYYKVKGEKGLNKVYERIRYENGYIHNVKIESTEKLRPTVNAVYVKGNKIAPSVGNIKHWVWPTKKPYVITSPYGPRWGSIHEAVDIVGGSGYGSSIFSANNGTIEQTGYSGISGNYIVINHNNGYYTYYCHLSKILVKKGNVVPAGTVIGKMGNTGYNALTGRRVGTHLHFGIWKGIPYGSGSKSYNPMRFY